MFETIERPSAGKPMRAAWGARLADRVNELCAAPSPGMLVREGLGGIGAEPTPASRRVRRSSAADLGCFAISSISPVPPSASGAESPSQPLSRREFAISLTNAYFRVGGITYDMGKEASTVSTVVSVPCIVYIIIDMSKESPVANLKRVDSIGEMMGEERNVDFYVLPLYAFDDNCAVVTDFRNAPSAAAFEFDAGKSLDTEEEQQQ